MSTTLLAKISAVYMSAIVTMGLASTLFDNGNTHSPATVAAVIPAPGLR